MISIMLKRLLLASILIMGLISCKPNNDLVTATPTQSLPTSVIIETTLTLTATPTQSAYPPPPPADLFATFLFQGDASSCQLPCWRGLVVGESTLDDVVAVLESDFGIIASPEPYGRHHPSVISLSHRWFVGNMRSRFGMNFLISGATERLEIIHFYTEPNLTSVITPQQILKGLGAPTYWFLAVSGRPVASFTSYMVYQNGIVAVHRGIMEYDTREGTPSNIGAESLEFCLDNSDFLLGIVHIGPPIQEWPSDMSPFIHELDSDIPTASIEEITGQTIEDITTLAFTQPDPCVEFPY